MGSQNMRNNITDFADKIKDKIIIVLGNTGVGKSSFINKITEKFECKVSNNSSPCTKKIKLVMLKKSMFNFYFIDTPGLSDLPNEELFNQFRNFRLQRIRINVIILCLKISDIKLNHSLLQALKIFIEIYPSKNFWDHVIIIRTFSNIHKSIENWNNKIKGKILKDIINNFELNKFMKDNNIIIPSKLKEYFVDNYFISDYFKFNNNYDKEALIQFEVILKEISKIYPLYREIKEELNIYVTQEKVEDSTFIYKKKINKITFIDFNSEIHNYNQLEEEKYNLNDLNKDDILNETLENKINFIEKKNLEELKLKLTEQIDTNIRLEKELDDEKNKNKKLNKQIEEDNSFKKKLEKEKKESFEEAIIKKDKEIQELKLRLSILQSTLEEKEKSISIYIISSDEKLKYTMKCKNTDEFKKIEKKLYEKYPEYHEINNNFILRGKIINKNMTLEQNNIQNNDCIILKIS